MNIFDKIQKIQALIDSTSSDGERLAAELAKQRLQQKIDDRPIEYKVTSHSAWEKKIFLAICKKNGLNPYRYSKQKYTTTMVRVSKSIMDEVLWPQYNKYTDLLGELVEGISSEIIENIYAGDKEETIISGEISCSSSLA